MEEHFEIGDLVAFTIKGIVYYGTIVSKNDRCANLDTYKLAIPLQELTHASGFRVGSIVRIKRDLRHGIQYGTLKFYNSDLCGTITTVTKVSRNVGRNFWPNFLKRNAGVSNKQGRYSYY